jgi:hypothetical protein
MNSFCKSVYCRLFGLHQIISLWHSDHPHDLSQIIFMLQDDYIVNGHVGTKVVIGVVFVCLVLLSVHKKQQQIVWIAVCSHVTVTANLL